MIRHHPPRALAADLRAMSLRFERRRMLQVLAGASLLPLLGCGGSGDPACPTIPDETAGPYPGDGSNGPNVLSSSAVVRSDIRSSFGALSGTAAGVPLSIKLNLVSSAASCAALAGYAVYLWHCDREGRYSLYTVSDQNYLRGVQQSDAGGLVSFSSIFPGAYSGRWPHIHFEIYASLAEATGGGDPLKTSQLALPEEACAEAYASSGYATSVQNLARTSLESDNVFGDGADDQLASVSGNSADGYVATLTVGLDA